MSNLSEYLNGQVRKDFAERVGISPAFLTQILQKKRGPSLQTAMKIEAATGGAVPVRSWDNLAPLLEAARHVSNGEGAA